MEKEPFSLSNATSQLVTTYKKIHTAIFRYMVYVFALLAGTVFAYQATQSAGLKAYTEPAEFQSHKLSLSQQFEDFMASQASYSGLELMILQGELTHLGDILSSQNNLIHYKWFVVPRVFVLNTQVPLLEKTIFTGSYDIKLLENLAQNTIFNTIPINIQTQAIKRSQLPIYATIEENFNLSCIYEPRFLQKACEYYTQNFLDTMFVYDLSTQYDNIPKISKRFKQLQSQHDEFCEALTKYVLYSNDTNYKLEAIFRECGEKSLAYFRTVQWFVEVQTQLQQGYASETLYANPDLNIYKLLSLQQLIYHDLKSKKINERIIFPYFSYVEQLLKQEQKEHTVYLELTYRFHNFYLKNQLLDPAFVSKKDTVDQVYDTINLLNKWSVLVWYQGLNDQIQNPQLLPTTIAETDATQTWATSYQMLLTQLWQLGFFTVTHQLVDTKKLSVEWIMTVVDTQKNKLPIKSILAFSYKNTNPVIIEASFPEYETLSTVVQELISQNDRSISDLYHYLNENYKFYSTNTSAGLDFCDMLAQYLENRAIQNCSSTQIDLQKTYNGKPINYHIILDRDKITTVEISDPDLQKSINDQIDWLITNNITLAKAVQFIYSYQPQQIQTDENDMLKDTLLVMDRFGSYLGINPDDVYKEEETLFIKFKLKWIAYLAEYELENHTIVRLYFDKVYYREGKLLPVKDFVLALDDANQSNINYFVVDSLWYIASINESAYNAYLKYK